jgi:hypothetical protein
LLSEIVMDRSQHSSFSIAILLLAAFLCSPSAQAADTIHVGKAQGATWTFLPLDIGIERGFFAERT